MKELPDVFKPGGTPRSTLPLAIFPSGSALSELNGVLAAFLSFPSGRAGGACGGTFVPGQVSRWMTFDGFRPGWPGAAPILTGIAVTP